MQIFVPLQIIDNERDSNSFVQNKKTPLSKLDSFNVYLNISNNLKGVYYYKNVYFLIYIFKRTYEKTLGTQKF